MPEECLRQPPLRVALLRAPAAHPFALLRSRPACHVNVIRLHSRHFEPCLLASGKSWGCWEQIGIDSMWLGVADANRLVSKFKCLHCQEGETGLA